MSRDAPPPSPTPHLQLRNVPRAACAVWMWSHCVVAGSTVARRFLRLHSIVAPLFIGALVFRLRLAPASTDQ